MPDDPFHLLDINPILPAGYNSAPLAGDELNAAGYNEPIWPEYFATFESLPGLFLTPDMLAWFENACPDVVIRRIDDTVVVPRETRTMNVRKVA